MPTRLESIVKTALIGTERRPLSAADLAAIGRSPGDADPAQTALEVLVDTQLRRKAGFLLADAPAERPAPAPFDDRPVCPPPAVGLLRQLLAGQHRLALSEFVALLTHTGQRLPPEILPEILRQGLESRTLFDSLEPLLGPVGYWLARQHLRWRALLPDPQADWFTASFTDRLRLLTATRRRSSPLVGLAWLEATWQQETGTHRSKFLAALADGLSPFDEPLLRRAAADKHDAVRMAALRLLDLLHLSPAEIVRMATARCPEYFPDPIQRDHWPEAARLDLLSTPLCPSQLLTGVWPGLLRQLAALDRATPGLPALEEVAKMVGYLGDLAALEAGLREQSVTLPQETGQFLNNVLSFRRQMATALIIEPIAVPH